MQRLSCFVRDTTDFVNKLSKVETTNKSTLLVSMDVTSLYTNIPTNEGIDAVNETLNSPSNFKRVLTSQEVVVEFLRLILTTNNFEFNDEHFLKIKGCSMGTICAPSYANIFMGKFEEKFIYPYIKDLGSLYLRYVDDI